jgi:large subunit ribosomal protein L29
MADKEETAELRELDVPSLIAALAEAKDNSFKLRFQNATGQLEKTTSLGEARKRIARISMLLREREIAAAESGAVMVTAAPVPAKKATAKKATAKKATAKKAAAKPAAAQKRAK